MAVFRSHKLLEFPSISPGASLPFHVSPLLSFSAVCFSPPRRRSSLPFSCSLSPISNSPSTSPLSPLVIISTTECSDGSIIFKFGDPSEIVEVVEDVNDSRDSDSRKEEGSISKAVSKEKVVINSVKKGSVSKEVNRKKFRISSPKASISKAVSRNDIVISSAKSGSISKEISKDKIVISSAKSGSIAKEINEDKIVVSSAKRFSSGGVVLEPNVVEMNTGHVEEKETSTSLLETRTDFRKESEGKHCSSDNVVLEPPADRMKTGNVVELTVLHTDANEQGTETGSDNVVLEPPADRMKTGNVVELTVLHTDANEQGIETGSDDVAEKDSSASMLENTTDFHVESGGNQIDDSLTSPKLSLVVDVEIISPSEEECPEEINVDDAMSSEVSIDLELPNEGCDSNEVVKTGENRLNVDSLNSMVDVGGNATDVDAMSSEVSIELELLNEGCDSNEVVKTGENRLNVDSLNSVVDVGGNATDDYEVELMPKHARLEADLALDEEIDDDLPSDLLVGESFVNSVVVDEGSCHAIVADERADSDVESNEISECNTGIEQTDTIARGEEVSSPTLTLASGAASLPRPSQSQVLTGAEDAYFVADEKWFIVVNSVGQWSLEGMKPGVYAHELVQNYQSLTSNSDGCKANVREALKQSASTVQSPGLASVLVAHFDKEVLHVANIGDTGFIIIRSGFVHKSSTPVIHEFNLPVQIGSSDDPLEVAEEYQIHLEDGDVIIMATDGLFDNLYEKDIASIISKSLQDKMKPKELAELLATRAQEVGRSTSSRCPFADEAQAAGYTGYSGGKLDHVTVVVSLVKKQPSPQE